MATAKETTHHNHGLGIVRTDKWKNLIRFQKIRETLTVETMSKPWIRIMTGQKFKLPGKLL